MSRMRGLLDSDRNSSFEAPLDRQDPDRNWSKGSDGNSSKTSVDLRFDSQDPGPARLEAALDVEPPPQNQRPAEVLGDTRVLGVTAGATVSPHVRSDMPLSRRATHGGRRMFENVPEGSRDWSKDSGGAGGMSVKQKAILDATNEFVEVAPSLSLSRSLSLSFSLSLARCYSLAHARSLSLSLSLSRSLSLARSLSLSYLSVSYLSRSLARSLADLSLSSLSLSLYIYISLSRSLALSLSRPLALSLSRSLALSPSRSLALSNSACHQGHLKETQRVEALRQQVVLR